MDPTRLKQLEEEYGILPTSDPSLILSIMRRLGYTDDPEYDPEHAHSMADALLCLLLEQLGHHDVVAAFEGIRRWYG